ncbi:DUF4430 domain-containing protein [Methanolobus psychrotolerans]|uniref:DUF4430 domain-containing protein n=1 Tax=Methanolobus psychrotolerans TaxID=1874706 RepID=UPI000B916B47|nr:DUF4430 domain-containing protein [Methanolobus psychrotolerans]
MKTETIVSIFVVALLSAMMIGTAAAEPAVIFDGSIGLYDGTFTFVPGNNPSTSYSVDMMTAMGALDAASNGMGEGFEYNASDAYYAAYGSFLLESISGIENEWDTQTNSGTSWFIYVNDEMTNYGLGLNDIEIGDRVTYLYAPYEYTESWEMIVDNENASYVVNILVEDSVAIFDGKLAVEDGTFIFVPCNNPSASYDVDTMTAMGVLNTAAEEEDFTYCASDLYYAAYGSFLLESIEGVENQWDTVTNSGTSWFIYVNDEMTNYGLSLNDIEVGDQVTYIYAPYEYTESWEMIVDNENTTYILDMDVRSADPVVNVENMQDYIDGTDAPACTKNILTTRLDSVIYSLDHDHDRIAVIKLRSFMNAVDRHEEWGNLTSEEADYLRTEADFVIEQIQD